LEKKDRVGRVKEKIIITHRNHGCFFDAASYVIETTSFSHWHCPNGDRFQLPTTVIAVAGRQAGRQAEAGNNHGSDRCMISVQ
jgi:hypothetical protein